MPAPLPRHHEHRSVAGGTARASVFGVSDGLVSNISLILGFAGSGVDASVVRLAGLAGLLAGAISMAAGEWVSVSAQNELITRELEVERRELARNPEAETAELTRLYVSRGVPQTPARQAAEAVMRVPETALSVHAREELGVSPDTLANPWLVAALSFACFALGAVLPVIPWFVGSGHAATAASVAIGVVAAAAVGAAIGRFAERGTARTAVRQVAILLVACGITYLVGQAVGVKV
jgi:VIT1/CCC1 family predicted Fe2+/Mn2+ transporter